MIEKYYGRSSEEWQAYVIELNKPFPMCDVCGRLGRTDIVGQHNICSDECLAQLKSQWDVNLLNDPKYYSDE